MPGHPHRGATVPALPENVLDATRATGPWEAPWIWILAAGVTALLIAGVWWLRRRRIARWSCLAAALVCAVFAVAAGVNSYVGYVRTTHDLARLLDRGGPATSWLAGWLGDDQQQDPEQREAAARLPTSATPSGNGDSVLQRISIADPSLHIPSGTTNVLLPPGYFDRRNAARRYPVVYLIHGYPYGGPDDWFTAGDAMNTARLLDRQRLVQPMILVGVDMTAGSPSTDWECLNVPHGPQLESYLTGTVPRRIDAAYRTIPNRAGRALGGMSGGGFCALNAGLHHTEEYSTMLITLPYDDLGDSAALLGGNRALVRANTPRAYLPGMRFPHPMAALIDVGTGAPTDVTTGNRIVHALQADGQNAVLHKEYGFNHTWHTARAALPYLLAYVSQQFRAPPTQARTRPLPVPLLAGSAPVHREPHRNHRAI
ncbi:alpha/beta hydrolase [Sciscionella marina]|uniref:alpha/beta hydrolase n=1 Tax=Sciscionella marina TaxID=508770 RepID=UPI00039E05E9|nr:alpha/beta hydrolase-fold protein [Sciscionella marina]